MTIDQFDRLFEAFKKIKVLIIGDVMVDSYLWGSVDRISPEAPVPIVNVKNRERRLGGAANVALNLKALGAEAILCAVIGKDTDGEEFKTLLDNEGLRSDGIVTSEQRVTTIKHRIISGSQQILRVDQEDSNSLNDTERRDVISAIEKLIDESDVVLFQDYDKGVLDESLISHIIALAKASNKPTVVDPKKRNFMFYKGATLFKPNLKELKDGLHLNFDKSDYLALREGIKLLRSTMEIDQALITLSEHGVALDNGSWHHVPAHIREIADVSGAGDTVVAVAALCLVAGLEPIYIAGLSNLAGGMVCEYVGVVPIKLDKFKHEVKALFVD